jgi:hypothetical protein
MNQKVDVPFFELTEQEALTAAKDAEEQGRPKEAEALRYYAKRKFHDIPKQPKKFLPRYGPQSRVIRFYIDRLEALIPISVMTPEEWDELEKQLRKERLAALSAHKMTKAWKTDDYLTAVRCYRQSLQW